MVWEIGRSDRDPEPGAGQPTASLPLERWEVARDLLAELWDWWVDGVHLCSQPKKNAKTQVIEIDPPYVVELIEAAMPRERDRTKPLPVPSSTADMDAHLGYALVRLNVFAHYYIALRRGWDGKWSEDQPEPRPSQSVAKTGQILFAVRAMADCAARINAPGTLGLRFARFQPLMGVDLRGCPHLDFHGSDLRNARIANGSFCDFASANLTGADFRPSDFLSRMMISFIYSSLRFCSFVGADVTGARFGEHQRENLNLTEAQAAAAGFEQDLQFPFLNLKRKSGPPLTKTSSKPPDPGSSPD